MSPLEISSQYSKLSGDTAHNQGIKIYNYTLTTYLPICKLDMFNLLTGGVKEHLVTHTGELKYSCPHCPKEFARPRELKNHVAFHTGNLPHKCSICAKAYPLQCQLDVSVCVSEQQQWSH